MTVGPTEIRLASVAGAAAAHEVLRQQLQRILHEAELAGPNAAIVYKARLEEIVGRPTITAIQLPCDDHQVIYNGICQQCGNRVDVEID